MPLAVENLTPTSTRDQIKKAIGDSISQCVSEGRPQDQCVAVVYQMAEKATGQSTGTLAGPGMEWG
jgi:hypothetical protein